MSKFTNTRENGMGYRRQLLATVSAIALLGSGIGEALAADNDRPLVWVELGGQLSQLNDAQESFAPSFVSKLLQNPFTPPGAVQAPPRFSMGEEASVSFSPKNSDWVFSAGIRYGKSNNRQSVHNQTSPANFHAIISVPAFSFYNAGIQRPDARRFSNVTAQTHASNLVLDFQAGKDVGLGILGSQGSSNVGFGVRFAQFSSRSSAGIDGDPNFAMDIKYATTFAGQPANIKRVINQTWDLYSAKMNVSRSFNGFGPSLKWDASATLAGHPDVGAITFDWGVNAAVLFGRQKMRAHHETSAHHGTAFHSGGALPTAYPPHSGNPHRDRSVMAPNLGGFAGLSYRYANAKLSVGYRADFFFNAMDGGIDTRKDENRGFFGPFASISIGVGGSSN